jgi:hypothetical protein
MVAGDIKRAKRIEVPPQPIQLNTELPEGKEGHYCNKKHLQGNENNQGLPTRVMLRTGVSGTFISAQY